MVGGCRGAVCPAGDGRVNGFGLSAEPAQVRASIGIVFPDYTLDDYLTAERNLAYHHCMIYHVPRRERRGRSTKRSSSSGWPSAVATPCAPSRAG
jgi:ABC-type multidrug transport system ATPase subunit